jgi:hypothetical protein
MYEAISLISGCGETAKQDTNPRSQRFIADYQEFITGVAFSHGFVMGILGPVPAGFISCHDTTVRA